MQIEQSDDLIHTEELIQELVGTPKYKKRISVTRVLKKGWNVQINNEIGFFIKID
jgi:hypothetical protein